MRIPTWANALIRNELPDGIRLTETIDRLARSSLYFKIPSYIFRRENFEILVRKWMFFQVTSLFFLEENSEFFSPKHGRKFCHHMFENDHGLTIFVH